MSQFKNKFARAAVAIGLAPWIFLFLLLLYSPVFLVSSTYYLPMRFQTGQSHWLVDTYFLVLGLSIILSFGLLYFSKKRMEKDKDLCKAGLLIGALNALFLILMAIPK